MINTNSKTTLKNIILGSILILIMSLGLVFGLSTFTNKTENAVYADSEPYCELYSNWFQKTGLTKFYIHDIEFTSIEPTLEKSAIVGNTYNGTKSLKAYWYKYDNKYYSIRIYCPYTTYAPQNSSSLFSGFESAAYITFGKNLNTSKVTNMNRMFSSCENLINLDLSSFDTSNVTDMSYMFYECRDMTNYNLGGSFNTSNVTNMSNMFHSRPYGGQDAVLTQLNLSNFNTSKVTDMSYMFAYQAALTSFDVSHFDTSNVTNMSHMFYCNDPYTNKISPITNLNLSNFNTSKVTDMSNMFEGLANLQNLNIKSFNTSNVTTMESMFVDCSSLTTLDVTKFDTSNVSNMRNMFANCSSLTSLDVTKFDTSNVSDMRNMFADCSSLTALDVTNFDTSNVADMSGMFAMCSKLTSLEISNFDTSKVVYMGAIGSAYGLSMKGMFQGCSLLTTIDVSNFDTSSLETIGRMFKDCSSLTYLDLSGFNFENISGITLRLTRDESQNGVFLEETFLDGTTNLKCLVLPFNVQDTYLAQDGYENNFNHTWILPTNNFYNIATGVKYSDKTVTSTNDSASATNPTTLAFKYNISYNMGSGVQNPTSNPTFYYFNPTQQTINLTAPTKENYTFMGWTTNVGTITNSTLTLPAETHQNITLTANWAQTQTITATVSGNGNIVIKDSNSAIVETIEQSGTATVEKNKNYTIYFTADSGYYVSEIKVDGVALTESALQSAQANGYTIENLAKDYTISATFSVVPPVQTYKINIETIGDGTATCEKDIETIISGEDRTIVIKTDFNKYKAQVYVDGLLVGSNQKEIKLENITHDINVKIVIIEKQFFETQLGLIVLTGIGLLILIIFIILIRKPIKKAKISKQNKQ